MVIADRRRVLRGMLNGAAVLVALPLLDCFLDANGTALASGAKIPVRFGTWSWGLGMNKQIFTPTKVGMNYDLPEQIASWGAVRQHISLFSNFDVKPDDRPNIGHYTGWRAVRTGEVPVDHVDARGKSIDVTIADALSSNTRFHSLELAATGNPCSTLSCGRAVEVAPPIISATQLYHALFNPTLTTSTPVAGAMLHRSVLTGVMEQSTDLRRSLGAADKARLDQYFTATRELERRLAAQTADGSDMGEAMWSVDALKSRHDLMTDLLVMAIASNQTSIFNMVYSDPIANTTRREDVTTHHTATHEEPVDALRSYQPSSAWYVSRAMEAFAHFVEALASVEEGDGTLLDRSLIFAHSDVGLAQTHSLEGIPMMLAGAAGGHVKTGIHVDGKGSVASRVGLTAMQALGLGVSDWGVGAMRTEAPIGEVLI
jgi:hypothetical protein